MATLEAHSEKVNLYNNEDTQQFFPPDPDGHEATLDCRIGFPSWLGHLLTDKNVPYLLIQLISQAQQKELVKSRITQTAEIPQLGGALQPRYAKIISEPSMTSPDGFIEANQYIKPAVFRDIIENMSPRNVSGPKVNRPKLTSLSLMLDGLRQSANRDRDNNSENVTFWEEILNTVKDSIVDHLELNPEILRDISIEDHKIQVAGSGLLCLYFAEPIDDRSYFTPLTSCVRTLAVYSLRGESVSDKKRLFGISMITWILGADGISKFISPEEISKLTNSEALDYILNKVTHISEKLDLDSNLVDTTSPQNILNIVNNLMILASMYDETGRWFLENEEILSKLATKSLLIHEDHLRKQRFSNSILPDLVLEVANLKYGNDFWQKVIDTKDRNMQKVLAY